jgi:hypothetical protein
MNWFLNNYSKLLGALQGTQKALGKQHDKITQAQLLKKIIQQTNDPNLLKGLKKAQKIIITNTKGDDQRQLKKAVKAFRIIRGQRDFWKDQFTIAQGKTALMKQSHQGIELNP